MLSYLPPAAGAEVGIFVSPLGSDSHAGSSAAPFLTRSRAQQAVPAAKQVGHTRTLAVSLQEHGVHRQTAQVQLTLTKDTGVCDYSTGAFGGCVAAVQSRTTTLATALRRADQLGVGAQEENARSTPRLSCSWQRRSMTTRMWPPIPYCTPTCSRPEEGRLGRNFPRLSWLACRMPSWP